MRLLGLDLETQSDDIKNTNITEIGLIQVEVDPDKNGYIVLEKFNTLLWTTNYPPQTAHNIELTGITDQMLAESGLDPRLVIPTKVCELMRTSDYVLAHNVKFDGNVLYNTAEKLGVELPEKKWICTLVDVPYADKYTCKKLAHLGFDHGLDMVGRELHRAIHDVQLMFDLVLGLYKFSEVLEYALSPWVYLKADIPKPWTDGGKGKDAAQKLGFSWQKARHTEEPVFQGSWVKRIKKCRFDQDAINAAPFPIEVLNYAQKQ